MVVNEISKWKEMLEVVQLVVAILTSILTALAIIAGAILYFKRRQRFPRAKITHQIFDKSIAGGKVLLRVIITVVNQGEVLLSLTKGHVGIKQLIPCPETLASDIELGNQILQEGMLEAPWEWLDHSEFELGKNTRHVEPGEEEEFHFDFIVNSNIKSVIVYSFICNKKIRRREVGWNKSTVFDLTSTCTPEPKHSSAAIITEKAMSQDKLWPPTPRDPSPPDRGKQGPPLHRPSDDRQGPPIHRPPPPPPPPPKKS